MRIRKFYLGTENNKKTNQTKPNQINKAAKGN